MIELFIWIFIYTCAWIDAGHYDNFQWVLSKKSRYWSRGTFTVCVSVPYLIAGDFWSFGYCFVFIIISFFGVFDFMLNIKRRDVEWDHIGSNSVQDSFWQERPELFLATKFSAILLCLLLFVIKTIYLK